MWGILLISGFVLSSAAQAALLDRGGGLVYDNVLDITWLQDANYALTSDYFSQGAWRNDDLPGDTPGFRVSSDGRLGSEAAIRWADRLVYGGYDDWRLPTTSLTQVSECQAGGPYSGGDCGFNIRTYDPETQTVYSELGYMFYNNLGNLAEVTVAFPEDSESQRPRGGSSGVDWGLVNTGLFENLHSAVYWTDVVRGADGIGLNAVNGEQLSFTGLQYAWAVRSGDVDDVSGEVPLPATLWLFVSGLAGLMGLKRQRQQRAN